MILTIWSTKEDPKGALLPRPIKPTPRQNEAARQEGQQMTDARGPGAAANMRVDGERLWDSLMQMARIGPGIAGGNNRQTLTDADAEGRALFRQWAEDAGMTLGLDRMGSMFLRHEGRPIAAAYPAAPSDAARVLPPVAPGCPARRSESPKPARPH